MYRASAEATGAGRNASAHCTVSNLVMDEVEWGGQWPSSVELLSEAVGCK